VDIPVKGQDTNSKTYHQAQLGTDGTTEHRCQIQKTPILWWINPFFSEGIQALSNAKLQALLERLSLLNQAKSDKYLGTFKSTSTKGYRGLLPLTSEGRKSLNDQRYSPQQEAMVTQTIWDSNKHYALLSSAPDGFPGHWSTPHGLWGSALWECTPMLLLS